MVNYVLTKDTIDSIIINIYLHVQKREYTYTAIRKLEFFPRTSILNIIIFPFANFRFGNTSNL